jgi:hypothetical protein
MEGLFSFPAHNPAKSYLPNKFTWGSVVVNENHAFSFLIQDYFPNFETI